MMKYAKSDQVQHSYLSLFSSIIKNDDIDKQVNGLYLK